MARSRNIKPGFFTNEDLVEFDFATRLLFAGLWTIADRDGRLQDRPKKIKIDVFPADNLDIDAMLTTLHNGKFILRYEIDGSKFIQITNWKKHQNPHHTEKASDIPDCNGCLTVKAPLEPKQSPKQDGGNLADSLLLIPDSLLLIPDPVPNGTADKSASELTKTELWKAGKSLLEDQRMPKAQCGSFVGQLVRDYGDQIVIDAVRAAVVTQPADAASYLKAACQHAAGQRKHPNKQEALEERNRKVADAWVNQGAELETV